MYIYRAGGMQATWVMQRARAHTYVYIYLYTNLIYTHIFIYICIWNVGNVGDAESKGTYICIPIHMYIYVIYE